MNPILKYPGAKWRIADWIIGHFPEHESYLEPFFGSGAIFFNKQPARIETINDLDGNVVRFFKTCRDQPDELARVLELTPWAREEFEEIRGKNTSDDIEAARAFAVRCWMSFGGRLCQTDNWRYSTGVKIDGGPDNPKLWSRLPQIVYEVASRLKQAQIENRSAVDVISAYNGSNVLIYADPPYVRETRTLHGDQYRCEMANEEHRKFLDVVSKHKGMILISGYDCDLYRESLVGWECDRLNTTAERGIRCEECLWINPAASRALYQQNAQCKIIL